MGLPGLPGPSEGVLCIILVNTAITIKIFKSIIRSLLHIVGIHLSSLPEESIELESDANQHRLSPPESLMEEFRKQVPTTRFGSVSDCSNFHQECRVCLTHFEPDSKVNILCCGHIFHKGCLEKWLVLWNFTCPLCRTSLMVHEEEEEENELIWSGFDTTDAELMGHLHECY